MAVNSCKNVLHLNEESHKTTCTREEGLLTIGDIKDDKNYSNGELYIR